GAGSRLGGTKALQVLGGRTFLDRVVSTCAESMADEVVVVVGAQADAVEGELDAIRARFADATVRAVRHDGWPAGRTSSIQAGVGAVAPSAHVLLFPVDMPCVRLVTLDALLGVFGYAAALPEIVVPVVVDADGARRRGHPI